MAISLQRLRLLLLLFLVSNQDIYRTASANKAAASTKSSSSSSSTKNNTTLVLELGLDNFAATLASYDWTCVLLYDPHDERETYEQSVVLEGLAERYARRGAEPHQQQYASTTTGQLPTVAFGRLNLRKHSMLRDILTGRSNNNHNDKPACPAQAYYESPEASTSNAFVMSPETLLEFSLGGGVYWPAQIILVGPDFNVYALLELREALLGSIPWKIVLLERWLHQHVVEEEDDDDSDDDDEQQDGTSGEDLVMFCQHMSKTHHLFDFDDTGCRIPRRPLFRSRSSMERDIRENHLAELWMDDSFTWDIYHKEQQQHQKQANTAVYDDYGIPIATQQSDSRRLLLETDAKTDDTKKQRGFFVYRKAAVKKIKPSAVYVDVLQTMVDEYLGWVVGYEVSWSEERKVREDEQTNFGVTLRRMNQQLQTLVEKLLTPLNATSTQTTVNNNNNISTDPRRDIPNLKGYFDELVFGPGRSAHSFRQVLADMADALGDTPEERRHQRIRFHGTEFPVVQPLRDYLRVLEDIHRDPSRYSIVLAEVTANWNNIMREFHKNLNKYYVTKYLKSSDPNNNNPPKFHFRTMDTLDMADPTHVNTRNTTLLTNYHDFHAKYTATGTPVILSNVRIAPSQVVTLQSIVQHCAASDVTNNVQVSQKVGERQASSEWGGLKTYVLEDSLLNEERQQGAAHRQKVSNNNAKKRRKTLSDSSDEDEEEEDKVGDLASDGIDRSLTMKQFAILSEQIDTLYLHDFTLEDNCDYFLYNHTPYDEQQKFQIPSVIASYDFFQRLPHSSFASSWPSLFVGKQGSNSKLHVDNGASGFFMYLILGQKRWIVYNRDERVHLYERIDAPSTYPDVLGIGKDQESDDFLSRRFPLLHRAEVAYEIIQEPGQLVYIPPNCPHAVENLEDTVGLAMNLVPREGVADHLHHQVHRAEFGVFDLAMNYLLFEDHADQLVDTIYTTFGEYKSQ